MLSKPNDMFISFDGEKFSCRVHRVKKEIFLQFLRFWNKTNLKFSNWTEKLFPSDVQIMSNSIWSLKDIKGNSVV